MLVFVDLKMVNDVCNQRSDFSRSNSPLLLLDLENEGTALSQKAGEYLIVNTSKNTPILNLNVKVSNNGN